MTAENDRPARLSEFRVVCRGTNATAYILHRAAADPAAAMASATAAGHTPILCMPFGLPRSEETLIIKRWRHDLQVCAGCGYSLEGLPDGPCRICPECGIGSPAAPATSPRPRTAVTRCANCGYCMSGIAIGPEPVRCPECGSDSPFFVKK